MASSISLFFSAVVSAHSIAAYLIEAGEAIFLANLFNHNPTSGAATHQITLSSAVACSPLLS
jgi:hypothetical protein